MGPSAPPSPSPLLPSGPPQANASPKAIVTIEEEASEERMPHSTSYKGDVTIACAGHPGLDVRGTLPCATHIASMCEAQHLE